MWGSHQASIAETVFGQAGPVMISSADLAGSTNGVIGLVFMVRVGHASFTKWVFVSF
jgi:hypothetical protein